MNHAKIYDLIIDRGKERITPDGYFERHHVVPRCMGGSDNAENIVKLTAREHFICHALLCYVYPENRSISYAFNCMRNRKLTGKRYFGSHEYEVLRKRHSKFASIVRSNNNKRDYSNETKKVMSEKQRTRFELERELKSGRYDPKNKRPMSNETKTRISKAKVGFVTTKEHGEKISRANTGRKTTDEAKAKKSATMIETMALYKQYKLGRYAIK